MPTTQIHCLGLNHRTAPVELRELFSAPLVDPATVLFPYLKAARRPAPSRCPAHAPHDAPADLGAGDRPGGNGNGRHRGVASDAAGGRLKSTDVVARFESVRGSERASACPFQAHRTSGDAIRAMRIAAGDAHPARTRRRKLARVGAFASIKELTFFATCNRMELYACVNRDEPDPRAKLLEFLAAVYPVEATSIEGHLYHRVGIDAVTHLCDVAAGLDSLVLGETQILGQIAGAYENALESITAGPVLLALYRAALKTGKRARTETTISSHPASMSSVAISAAQDVIGDLHERQVLVVGAGETGLLTLKVLHARGFHRVAVANRTPEKIAPVARQWGFRVYSLDELPEALAQSGAVISSTAAQAPIIDADMVRNAVRGREGGELVLIDIAVPRDIAGDVKDIPGVHLFDTDDLKGELDRAVAARECEIPKVKAIVEHETARYERELLALSMTPLITDLRDKAETIRRYELDRTLKRLPNVDSATRERISYLTRAIVNKILHEPTVRLKEHAQNGHSDPVAETLRDLFGLAGNGEG